MVSIGQNVMVEHRDASVVQRRGFRCRPGSEHRRHMVEVNVARSSLGILPIDVVGLLHAFFVRVRVLLEALDAVFDLWASEAGKESARLDDADVHDGAVEAL